LSVLLASAFSLGATSHLRRCADGEAAIGQRLLEWYDRAGGRIFFDGGSASFCGGTSW
jgi:hypothetical protein